MTEGGTASFSVTVEPAVPLGIYIRYTAGTGDLGISRPTTLITYSVNTSYALEVLINDDTTVEDDETFTVELTSSTGVVFIQAEGTITGTPAGVDPVQRGDRLVAEIAGLPAMICDIS